MFCAMGLVAGLVLGFVGGVVFGSRWPKGWGGGGGFPLALANTGHLVELGVVWVFHQDDPCFSPADTGDGTHVHARGVRDVDFGADEGVVGTIKGGGGCLGGGGDLCGGGGLGGGGWLDRTSHRTQKPIWSFSCHVFW